MFHFIMCLPILLLAAPPADARPKPNFTGAWRANFARSKLQIKQPDSTEFTIDHRDPDFSLSRTHMFEGKSDTWGLRLRTDGKVVVVKEANRTLRARITWEGDALVFEVTLEMESGPGHDRVKYTISRDRRTFTAFEKYTDAQRTYENVWVFDRVR